MKRGGEAMFEQIPEIIGVEQMCGMLNIGRKAAYDLIKRHEIPSRRIGRRYRIRKDAVIDFMSEDK